MISNEQIIVVFSVTKKAKYHGRFFTPYLTENYVRFKKLVGTLKKNVNNYGVHISILYLSVTLLMRVL